MNELNGRPYTSIIELYLSSLCVSVAEAGVGDPSACFLDPVLRDPVKGGEGGAPSSRWLLNLPFTVGLAGLVTGVLVPSEDLGFRR